MSSSNSTYAFDCTVGGTFTAGQTTVGNTTAGKITATAVFGGPGPFPGGDDSLSKLMGNNGTSVLGLCQPTSTSAQTYLRFLNGATAIGNFASSSNGTSIAFSTPSDARRKCNIRDTSIDQAGQVIDSLRVRNYSWKVDPDGDQVGFIAQEMQEVLPGAVAEQDDEDRTLMIDTSVIIPYLVKTVQELRSEVARLRDDNMYRGSV